MVVGNFPAVIKDFNRRFKCKFYQEDIELTALNLKIKEGEELNNTLICLTFLYFKNQRFQLTRKIKIKGHGEKINKCISKLFSKPPIIFRNQDFLIVIRNKFRNTYDKEGVPVTACQDNDIGIFSYKDKTFYCKSNSIHSRFNELIKEAKIEKDFDSPKKVNSSFIKKIIESKKLSIHEIELHNLSYPDIREFYLKLGSKKSRINKKIKSIKKKILNNKLYAFNIKSILLSEKSLKTKRIRISIKQDGARKYHLEIKTKNPDLNLKKEIEKILKDDGIKFNQMVMFTDEPLRKTIMQLIRKTKLEDYKTYMKDISEWDKHNLLKFDRLRLKPVEEKIIQTIKKLAEDKYVIRKNKLCISGIKIKGYLIIRNEDKKNIFFFLNKGHYTDKKRIEILSRDKRIPFFAINLRKCETELLQEVPFTKFNEISSEEWTKFLDQLLDNPHLFNNLKKNFEKSFKELVNIRKKLSKVKSNQKKGELWERICLNILDFTFKDTFPLGRSYLPDGITYFSKDESIIWDSKALLSNNSYFSQSVKSKKGNNIKDTFYIAAFKDKKFNFKYYIYLTINVNKKEFNEVKKKIDNYLKKKKINVKIVCLTEKWLESFSKEFLNEENHTRFHKNLPDLIKIIKKEFNKGFLSNFDNRLLELVGSKKLIPTKTIRNKIKQSMK